MSNEEARIDFLEKEEAVIDTEDLKSEKDVKQRTPYDSNFSQILLKEEEAIQKLARERACRNTVPFSFLINGYSAILIFVFHLISLEAVFSVILGTSMTICKKEPV